MVYTSAHASFPPKLTTRREHLRFWGRAALTLAAGQLAGCFHGMVFKGGDISKISESQYRFTAQSENDPGVMMFPRELGLPSPSLRGKQFLKFEARGWIKKEGVYAHLLVQVYDAKDGSSNPSVSRQFEVSEYFRPVTIPLDGKINELQKLQFMLITDKGSCEIYVRHPRFE